MVKICFATKPACRMLINIVKKRKVLIIKYNFRDILHLMAADVHLEPPDVPRKWPDVHLKPSGMPLVESAVHKILTGVFLVEKNVHPVT